MESVSYTTFWSDLRSHLDKVCDDAKPILVTGEDSSSDVVVISARECDNMVENLYIRSNPYLMKKIERGIEQFAAANWL